MCLQASEMAKQEAVYQTLPINWFITRYFVFLSAPFEHSENIVTQ